MRRDDRVNGFCSRNGYVLLAVVFAVFAIQTVAIYDFLYQCCAWWPVSSFFGALIASSVPVFGAFAAVAAAAEAWGWRWYLAAMFFFAPLLFMLSAALFLTGKVRLMAFWRRRADLDDDRMPVVPWFDGDRSDMG